MSLSSYNMCIKFNYHLLSFPIKSPTKGFSDVTKFVMGCIDAIECNCTMSVDPITTSYRLMPGGCVMLRL